MCGVHRCRGAMPRIDTECLNANTDLFLWAHKMIKMCIQNSILHFHTLSIHHFTNYDVDFMFMYNREARARWCVWVCISSCTGEFSICFVGKISVTSTCISYSILPLVYSCSPAFPPSTCLRSYLYY